MNIIQTGISRFSTSHELVQQITEYKRKNPNVEGTLGIQEDKFVLLSDTLLSVNPDSVRRATSVLKSERIVSKDATSVRFSDAFAGAQKLRFKTGIQKVIIDKKVYDKVYKAITNRYQAFSHTNEIGFDGKPGVTGDIDDISIKDLIHILRHIAVTEDLSAAASKKSAISPLFDKTYLMENKKQGWNLRLHQFSPVGGVLGEEELPHWHRWTLASAILLGGYNNKSYIEIPIEEATEDEKFYRYRLDPSPADTAVRQMVEEGQYGVRVTEQIFLNKGMYATFL